MLDDLELCTLCSRYSCWFSYLFSVIIREKSFPEMKKDVGMTTAQKSKETRMEMGSIFVLYIQPTIPTLLHYSLKLPDVYRVASDYSAVMYIYVGIVGLDIQNKD